METEDTDTITTIFDTPADDEQQPEDSCIGSKYHDEDGDD